MFQSDTYQEAFDYACTLHAGQTRKGTKTPYVSHLLAVSAMVMDAGGSNDQIVAALLHDAPEDQGGVDTLDEIRNRFGGSVADIVEECSENLNLAGRPWRERKTAFLDSIKNLSPEAHLVVTADKLHNVMSLMFDYHNKGEALWSVFNAGRDDQLWYYRSVADKLYARNPVPLSRSLKQMTENFEAAVS